MFQQFSNHVDGSSITFGIPSVFLGYFDKFFLSNVYTILLENKMLRLYGAGVRIELVNRGVEIHVFCRLSVDGVSFFHG